MTYIIAEIGVNHDGSIVKALELIEAAKDCGADCVKFQLFSSERLGEPALKPLELSPERVHRLKLYCDYKGIDFLCTAFDVISAQQLKEMGCASVKLSSRDATNQALIGFCAANFDTVYLSTGNPGGGERELTDIWRVSVDYRNIVLMHCVSEYPCPPEHARLRRIWDLEEENVGYSDHTIGTVAPVAAVSLGASVIEKHFTLDTSAPGPDHHMSADPDTFRAMVKAIREVELMLG